jgi:pimeloyl-ACP methyl ester carboxylesterase
MVQQFVQHPNDYLIWPHYDAITCPVLCLRGEKSDLVLPEVVAEMHMRGPGLHGQLQVVEVPGCGHAPALNVPSHFKWVTEFLAMTEHTGSDD